MSVAPNPKPVTDDPPVLENGDHMTREEFHRIYEQMPEDFRAELIGGIVFVASPLKRRHGRSHLQLGSVFAMYEAHTPGTEAGDSTTVQLGDDSEPQPDLNLRILPEFGGQSRNTPDDYIGGAPELVAEIALSSRAIDLNRKRDDYRRYGVREYLVVSLKDQRIFWFDLAAGGEPSVDTDGVLRAHTFPGLWVNVIALFQRDHDRLMATLNEGVASAEHAAFVARLAEASKKLTP